MAELEDLVKSESLNLKDIVRALKSEYFPDLGKYMVHVRYKKRTVLPPMRAYIMDWCGRLGFSYIPVDPLLKEAGTSAIIGGLAHELGHVVDYKHGREFIFPPEKKERTADRIGTERGLAKYLYSFTMFIEQLPPKTYGFTGDGTLKRLGMSSDELAALL